MGLGGVVLAAVLATAPPGARAADLVVWWEEGFYPQENEAVREIIGAFEQKKCLAERGGRTSLPS